LKLLSEKRQMQRMVLTPLLITAMLFGQSACCCTFRALMISFSSKGDGSTKADTCCCTEPGNKEGECPHRSKDSGHKCPCRKGQTISAKLDSDPPLPSTQFADWFRIVCQYESFVQRLSVAVVPTPDRYGSSAFPHLDRAGILRAVNSLRC